MAPMSWNRERQRTGEIPSEMRRTNLSSWRREGATHLFIPFRGYGVLQWHMSRRNSAVLDPLSAIRETGCRVDRVRTSERSWRSRGGPSGQVKNTPMLRPFANKDVADR